MTRAALAVVWCIVVTPLAAQLPETWRQWLHAATIDAGEVPAPRLTSVVVTNEVTSRAQPDLGDLRVIDDAGREVPYVLHARFGGPRLERRTGRVLEPSFVPGKYAQIIVDAGPGAAIHNSVRLQLQTSEDLITWVEIAVSDDTSEWRVVRERGAIFRLTREGRGEKMDVSYPGTPARFLRARVMEDPARYQLTGAEIGFETSPQSERVAVDLSFVRRVDDPRRSVWQSPAGVVPRPISEIRFETSRQGFFRPVSVEWSDDGQQWMPAGSGEISRSIEGGQPRESLSIAFPERRANEWRVSVFNGNDTALPDLSPTAFATPRRVVFRQEPVRRYMLIYGHPRAPQPQNDMMRLVDASALDTAAEASLGPIVTNEQYDNPAPWTERNPLVIWAALVIVVIVLGWLAIKSLKSA
jgi:hypothetical protein